MRVALRRFGLRLQTMADFELPIVPNFDLESRIRIRSGALPGNIAAHRGKPKRNRWTTRHYPRRSILAFSDSNKRLPGFFVRSAWSLFLFEASSPRHIHVKGDVCSVFALFAPRGKPRRK